MFDVYLVLCLTAALGGAINSVAGGGTLLTFPALFAALGDNVDAAAIANATSTLALFPGSVAGMWGYRREIVKTRRWSLLLVTPSIVGGMLGSLLVVLFPHGFKQLVPWLILTAAVLFCLQPQIARLTGVGHQHAPAKPLTIAGVVFFQLLVAIYGGYFGAGIGILMLSSLGIIGMTDIHEMNAVKTLLASLINGISSVVFIVNGRINWPFALAMAAAAIIGGYLGASVARQLNRRLVRAVVVTIGFVLASYYFYKQLAA